MYSSKPSLYSQHPRIVYIRNISANNRNRHQYSSLDILLPVSSMLHYRPYSQQIHTIVASMLRSISSED